MTVADVVGEIYNCKMIRMTKTDLSQPLRIIVRISYTYTPCVHKILSDECETNIYYINVE